MSEKLQVKDRDESRSVRKIEFEIERHRESKRKKKKKKKPHTKPQKHNNIPLEIGWISVFSRITAAPGYLFPLAFLFRLPNMKIQNVNAESNVCRHENAQNHAILREL